LYPGELFWFVLDGDARSIQDGFSWLDSADGVAWTAFQATRLNGNKLRSNENDDGFGQKVVKQNVGWVVERSRGASSASVLVD
jgi:hypothetical protein